MCRMGLRLVLEGFLGTLCDDFGIVGRMERGAV